MATPQPTGDRLSFQPRSECLTAEWRKVIDRITAKVAFDRDGCWLWQGGVTGKGYGHMRMHLPGWPACRPLIHRITYTMCVGPIPEGMFVCHRCDTPRCVRPDHFFLGTGADNMADKMAKGRHRVLRGEAVPTSVITETVVREIRRRASAGESQASIIRSMSLSRSIVHKVVARQRWKHVV